MYLILVDNFYWLNYNVQLCTTKYNKDVKQLQQILILVHFRHLYLDQHLILHFLIMFLFQEIIILRYSLPYFKNNPIFNFIYIDMRIMYSKLSRISEIEYDPSGKSNSSFQFGAEILSLLLLYADLMFFHVA